VSTDLSEHDGITEVNDDVDKGAAEDAALIEKVEKALHETPVSEEAKPETEEPDEEEAAPEEMDEGTLRRALAAGFDEDSAKRFHQAGLLGDALVTFDRRLINSIKPPEGQDETRQEETPPRREPAKTEERGRQPLEGEPAPLSAEDYGEGAAARDQWHSQQIDTLRQQNEALQQQVEDLNAVARMVLQERRQGFSSWIDSQIGGLDNKELFGEAELDQLAEASTERGNRMKLADAYFRLCVAHGVDPQMRVGELMERAYYATFGSSLVKNAKRDVVKRMRDASTGQFTKRPHRSPDGPPDKPATPEEQEAALVSLVDDMLHGRAPKKKKG
jgi:hypothetical protein